MSKKLIGEDPFNIEAIVEKFHMKSYFHGYFGLSAIAGIEIALWDIIAKKADRPLCDMIGGMYRKEVPFSGYIFFRLKDENTGAGGESPLRI
jgi:L-alanine-DL-glutamate epimerase-like enolase superfamily enzyme